MCTGRLILALILSGIFCPLINGKCLSAESAGVRPDYNENISIQNINVLTAIEVLRVMAFDNAKYGNNNQTLAPQIDWLAARLKKEETEPLKSVRNYILALKMIKDFHSMTKTPDEGEKINSDIRKLLFDARDNELLRKHNPPVKKFWKLSIAKQSNQGSRPNCAATCINMLLNYYRINVESPTKLAKIINYPGTGATVEAILNYLNESNIPFRYYMGSLTDLREQISGGNPVLVLQAAGLDYRKKQYKTGHVRLAVGYNDATETVNVIDPNYGNRKFKISYSDFELLWLPGGFYCIVLER